MRKIITCLVLLSFFLQIQAQNFTWTGGDKYAYPKQVYGAQGVAAAANNPGIRYNHTLWTDNSGNVWLFGGQSSDEATYQSNNIYKNDLWKFDPVTNQWTWMKGSTGHTQVGIYGTINIENAANTPGSRAYANTWTDASGNLWLFGGFGYGNTNSPFSNGGLNDLWMYNTATNNWVWKGGSQVITDQGNAGTIGVESASNWPQNRINSAAFKDNAGNFWIQGGTSGASCPGMGCTTFGPRNDLWRYNMSNGQWTWMKGDNSLTTSPTYGAIYGAIGIEAAANKPPGTTGSAGFTDAGNNLWLFGGMNNSTYLWRYNISTNNWTWMKSGATNGTYGTMGTAAAGNVPGNRTDFAFASNAGQLWIFGGVGNALSSAGYLNDVWRFDPATNNWTWMKGSSAANSTGSFGIQGTTIAANSPSARAYCKGISNGSGTFYLLMGEGLDQVNLEGTMNDVWKFETATSNWTWIKGVPTLFQGGTYGTINIPSVNNKPGVRLLTGGWRESSNIYLFGGLGNDANGISTRLNDLWKYNTTNGEWTWLKGSSSGNQQGVFGTIGVEAAGNFPSARSGHLAWTGDDGNFYLMGGFGFDNNNAQLRMNDLWRYNPSNNNWTWIKGDNIGAQFGVYGTQGVSASGNKPGVRERSATWKDNNGNLWMFGGIGLGESGSIGQLNDLWKYDITTNNWTWMKGSKLTNQFGTYGATQGELNMTHTPGARENASTWTDNTGNLWLFGGFGFGASGSSGYLMDLWRYDITTNIWTWFRGLNSVNATTIYGTQGVQDAASRPGGRAYATSFTAINGTLWMYGGYGYASTSSDGLLSDLWRYDIASNEWTWFKGSNNINSTGNFGTLGTEAVNNFPSARYFNFLMPDNNNNLWLFGGIAEPPVSTNVISSTIRVNDVWRLNVQGALPLTWIYFNVSKANAKTELKWITDNEENTSHFDIERSSSLF